MSQNINGFDFDKNYELQVRNNGKKTGLTFEFYNDLQKYIDEGIFVDELNDGFSAKEKLGLADAFMRIHKEKGYDTNFSKMKVNAKFVYTAQDYIDLAKAAGFVLKDLSPEEQAKLVERIEKSAKELTNNQPGSLQPIEGIEFPTNIDVPNPNVELKQSEIPMEKMEFAKSETVKNDRKKESSSYDVEQTPADVSKMNDDKGVKLPMAFLKRYKNEKGEDITPDNFKDLSQEKQSELIEKYQKACENLVKMEAKDNRARGNIFTKIFGGGKHSDIAKVDHN